jgi:mono/diheme cytochrome c family protein
MRVAFGSTLALTILAAMTPQAVMADAASNRVYDATCALCHQVGAIGLKGQFPRLASRVDRMARDPQARTYLIQAVLFGISGKMEVDGASIVGVMPGFTTLSDADVASVLNYLARLGERKGKPAQAFTVAEISAIRGGGQLTPSQVMARRALLVGEGRIP